MVISLPMERNTVRTKEAAHPAATSSLLSFAVGGVKRGHQAQRIVGFEGLF